MTAMISLLWLAACHVEHSPPATTPTEVEAGEALPIGQQLARASLDIRGVRPTPAELEEVEADPTVLPELLEGFLQDPRFADQVRATYQEAFLTRLEELRFYDYAAVYAQIEDPDAFIAAAGEEPLRLMAHLAMNDLPYELAVTGDFTVIDETLAPLFPTDRPDGAEGWVEARYTDGRPAAGVLTTNGLWWRYAATASNKQRKRANVASRLFVCRDFLKTPVVFDNNVNLLDEEALNDAIATNPSCKACHDDIEPIAGFFWGFDFDFDAGFLLADGVRYHPERERQWQDLGGIAPAWFGVPGTNLADLGRAIAADPDFDPCAVQQVYQHLLRRPLVPEDGAVIADLVRSFRQNGHTVRAIWRAILADPRYQGVVSEGVTGAARKMMTPELLRSVVLDLTGFDWTVSGVTQLDHEQRGVETLAGGIDGTTVTVPAWEPNTTVLLVQDRVATGAAAYAVESELALSPSARKLFGSLTFTETMDSDSGAITAQLVALYRTVLGRSVAADGPEVTALAGLWSEVYALDPSPTTAWKAVLSALLRDPDFVMY